MIKIKQIVLAVIVCAGCSNLSQRILAQGPIRPLAQNYVLIAKSADSKNEPLYSPSILRLSTGRLVISYTEARKKDSDESDYQIILTSDDGGLNWTKRFETTAALQGRIFEANGILYYISTGAGLPVCKSADSGVTWSTPVYLTGKDKTWQQTAANVWYAHGNVYLEMELRVKVINAWGAGEKAPVLLRAKVTDDLTKAASWTFASVLDFADLIPCYRDNQPKIDFFGVPFYPQTYPDRSVIAPGRSFSPMGWAEGNVVQILDPNHYWYDDSGSTFHIFLRSLTGMTNYGAVCKVVENEDGTMTTMLETTPSGKKILFLPLPGGHNRFHILYDTTTKTYWLLSNQSTDSMTKAELLPADRHDLAFGERNRLVLHFSKNMVDWCFAGVVAIGATQKEARSYAAMDFDGNDLVILSRSGDPDTYSAHETNMITFHRVKNFRDLIY
ncbi:MAG: sialidase family protein [Paludibacteraceae bacterium]